MAIYCSWLTTACISYLLMVSMSWNRYSIHSVVEWKWGSCLWPSVAWCPSHFHLHRLPRPRRCLSPDISFPIAANSRPHLDARMFRPHRSVDFPIDLSDRAELCIVPAKIPHNPNDLRLRPNGGLCVHHNRTMWYPFRSICGDAMPSHRHWPPKTRDSQWTDLLFRIDGVGDLSCLSHASDYRNDGNWNCWPAPRRIVRHGNCCRVDPMAATTWIFPWHSEWRPACRRIRPTLPAAQLWMQIARNNRTFRMSASARARRGQHPAERLSLRKSDKSHHWPGLRRQSTWCRYSFPSNNIGNRSPCIRVGSFSRGNICFRAYKIPAHNSGRPPPVRIETRHCWSRNFRRPTSSEAWSRCNLRGGRVIRWSYVWNTVRMTIELTKLLGQCHLRLHKRLQQRANQYGSGINHRVMRFLCKQSAIHNQMISISSWYRHLLL